jgi:phosphoenolpyruvate carboxylase
MKASLNSLHHQVTDWLRETEFYKQELAILQTRLEEVAAKNTAQEVLAQVEHFQNKFILNREQQDTLLHDLRKEASNLEEKIKGLLEHTNEKFTDVNEGMQNRMKTFAAAFADLRFEFNSFVSKVI